MGKRGGVRPNSGRKSKAEELGLDHLMDSIGPTEEVLKAVYKLATTNKSVEAQKLWLSYKFGKPKENVTVKQDTVIQWIEEDGNKSS